MKLVYHSTDNKYTMLTMTKRNNSIFLTMTKGYKNSNDQTKITIKLDTKEVAYIKEVLSKYLSEMIDYEDHDSNRNYSNY